MAKGTRVANNPTLGMILVLEEFRGSNWPLALVEYACKAIKYIAY
jgi:hypothetical protein